MNTESQVCVELKDRAGRGQVAYVTINNPRRANSLNSELMDEFVAALEQLADNDALRVLVLTGAGETAFCGGANVHELAQLDAATGRVFITRVHRMSKAVRELPVPVIARVNGVCLGAGLELMAACDIRVAVETALFGMPEVKVGLPSVVEAALFPQLIGWGRTKQLIYTAKNISAREGQAWGLVEEVATTATLDAEVEQLVGAIVDADADAIRIQKELMRSWEALPVSDAIQEGIRAFSKACAPGTHRDVVRGVIERLKSGS
jgi:enoyl-CoA hydratase/carnithine racemase